MGIKGAVKRSQRRGGIKDGQPPIINDHHFNRIFRVFVYLLMYLLPYRREDNSRREKSSIVSLYLPGGGRRGLEVRGPCLFWQRK